MGFAIEEKLELMVTELDEATRIAEEEDKLDNEQRSLIDQLKIAETNAEFGERTVEKLERTIDGIQESLYEEKMAYRALSCKLDSTLRDMMQIADEHSCE